ncbi:hypothetical protein [Streptomyces sp. FZ201]|uniref:DUF6907 domain-containing protein n=1 Tax=Streptomyces sp. FZ201 TaxID=3057122 RepID=UPI0021C0CB59|nr:hypothetical protein [Streptomyces sp. FZ201]
MNATDNYLPAIPTQPQPAEPPATDWLATVLPAAVDEAMRKTLPGEYTPELAAQIAEGAIARLTGRTPACPDGIDWCTGDPDSHADPHEHRHVGTPHALTGPYLSDKDREVLAFELVQWTGAEPRLSFQADGTWPDLDIDQVDALVRDLTAHLIALRVEQRRMAILLDPPAAPATETEDERTALAAFETASDALAAALEKTGDRPRMLTAFRALLDVSEDAR